MIELLDPDDSLDRGGRSHVRLSFLINKQVDAMNKAVDYYKSKPTYIKAQHLLSRLIEDLNYGDSSPITSFNKCVEELDNLCIIYGLTTSTNKGNLHQDDFPFSKGYAILSTNETKSRSIMSSKFADLNPMRMVHRGSANAMFELPTPDATHVNGFGAFTLDLPCLAAMVAGWKIENTKRTDDSQISKSDLISKYILSTLLRDQCRLSYLYMCNDLNQKYIKSDIPFTLVDQTTELKKEIESVKSVLNTSSIHHSNIMAEFPVLDLASFYDAIPKVEVDYLTESNRWVKLLAEYPIVEATLSMAKKDNDSDLPLRLKVYTRTLNSHGVLRKSPSDKMNKYLSELYSNVVSLITKK